MRVCSEPGCPALTTTPRCDQHRRRRDDPASRYRSSYTWQTTRARILDQWRTTHGNWCPGDTHHQAHPSDDLTVEHLDELNATGGYDTGRHAVVCRPANSSRRASQPRTPRG